MTRNELSLTRRDFVRRAGLGLAAYSVSGWLGALAHAADGPARRRSCILLWMSGGPSQLDTFDPKPGHRNGGPFKEINTNVPGLRISEHLPKVANRMDRLSIVRSVTSKLGDHGLATDFVHTGYLPRGPVAYPTLGSLVAKELGSEGDELPAFVSVGQLRATFPASYSAGFLGPRHAPLAVGGPAASLRVENLAPPSGIDGDRRDARLRLVRRMQQEFLADHASAVTESHCTAYERAARLMSPRASRAFDLDEEKAARRDAYGRTFFGQGCLLARRLVERGVSFVEVAMEGWDTHQANFDGVTKLSQDLDSAWSALIDDLRERGMLDSTLVVWMGEFGRSPLINAQAGRDHFPNAYAAVLAGGGIRGGQAVGRTSAGGEEIEDRPVTVPDLLATVCQCVGIDSAKQNESNTGRPVSIVDKTARPIVELIR